MQTKELQRENHIIKLSQPLHMFLRQVFQVLPPPCFQFKIVCSYSVAIMQKLGLSPSKYFTVIIHNSKFQLENLLDSVTGQKFQRDAWHTTKMLGMLPICLACYQDAWHATKMLGMMSICLAYYQDGWYATNMHAKVC